MFSTKTEVHYFVCTVYILLHFHLEVVSEVISIEKRVDSFFKNGNGAMPVLKETRHFKSFSGIMGWWSIYMEASVR